MKIYFTFIGYILLYACAVHAQPTIQWQWTFGGSAQDAGYAIQQTPDGGYIVVGYSNSNNDDFPDHHGTTAYADMIVIKFDSTGTVQWKHSLGGSNNDRAACVALGHGGGYLVAGGSASNDGDVTDHHGAVGILNGWIVRLDSVGNTLWSKSYGGTSGDDILRIIPTTGGGYVFAARSFSMDGEVTGHHGDTTTSDYWVVRIDSVGNILWEESLGGAESDAPFGLTATDDSAYVLSGDSESNDDDVSGNHGGSDIWVVKINDTGKIEWENSFGSPFNEDQNSIVLASDGGYIIGGSSYGSGDDITVHYGHNDEYDIWVFKLARDGTLLWQKTLGGTGRDYEQDIHAMPNGSCVVSGYSTSNDIDVTGHHGDTTTYDAWVLQLDSLGNLKWEKSLGGSNLDGASGITPTTDGGYIFTGNTQSTDGDLASDLRKYFGNGDGWIVKLAPIQGSNSVREPNNDVSGFDVYPNPARFGVTIQLNDIFTSGEATVEISDLLGNVRKEIHSQNAGTTLPLAIDVSQFATGAYIVSAVTRRGQRFSRILSVMK